MKSSFRINLNGKDVVGGDSGTTLGKLGLDLAKKNGIDVGRVFVFSLSHLLILILLNLFRLK